MTQPLTDPPASIAAPLDSTVDLPGVEPTGEASFHPLIRPRRWVYPLVLAALVVVWAGYMSLAGQWGQYGQNWPMAVTMAGGSFVAGATPMGGAAVSFPVFTKLLHIPTAQARTFGLMIQSIGMVMASLFILTRGIRFLPEVVVWASLGGFAGMLLGTYVVVLPDPYPRVLFSLGVASYAVAQDISRWVMKSPPRTSLPAGRPGTRLALLGVGLGGGFFAAHTGSGVDMMTFILITLAFAVDEKIGTPTSVLIMALNSVFGFGLHALVSGDIGIVWQYWLVAVPVVAIGAPLGAFFASKVRRDVLILFTLTLIAVEFLTTLLLVPFTQSMLLVSALVVALCALSFWGMLRYRRVYIDPA
jgi:uncharacterized membrane protein YfcA